jgi:hypothetical protein
MSTKLVNLCVLVLSAMPPTRCTNAAAEESPAFCANPLIGNYVHHSSDQTVMIRLLDGLRASLHHINANDEMQIVALSYTFSLCSCELTLLEETADKARREIVIDAVKKIPTFMYINPTGPYKYNPKNPTLTIEGAVLQLDGSAVRV